MKRDYVKLPEPKNNLKNDEQNKVQASQHNPEETQAKIVPTLINHSNPMAKRIRTSFLIHSKNAQKILSDKQTSNSEVTPQIQPVKQNDCNERVKTDSFTVEPNDRFKEKLVYLNSEKQEYIKLQEQKKISITKVKNSDEDQIKITEKENEELKKQIHELKDQVNKLKVDLKQKQKLLTFNNGQLNDKNIQILDLSNQLKIFKMLESQNKNLLAQNIQHLTRCSNSKANQAQHENLKHRYLEIIHRCQQLQQILQQKDQYIHTTLKAKNDEYNAVVQSKNNQIRQMEHRLSFLENQLIQLVSLTKKIQKQSIQASKDIIIDAHKFEELSASYQLKINLLQNQNQKLKNCLNSHEGKLEQLKITNVSLLNNLKAFEQRDKIDRIDSSSIFYLEVEQLNSKLSNQKEEYDSIISKLQLQILKLQNVINTKKYEFSESLLDFLTQKRLQQSLLHAIDQIQRLNNKLLCRK